jgi:hypothetical protein
MNDWKQHYREKLSANLDPQGDLVPPWERFPEYEHFTIGWRMGIGEDWMGLWSVFLEQLEPDFETRLSYLKRHPPAPVTWADAVYLVLYPGLEDEELDGEDEEDKRNAKRRAELLKMGLIASDIAFTTWLNKQADIVWPWSCYGTPKNATRYSTRNLWFWSRQVGILRQNKELKIPQLPLSWRSCENALKTGTLEGVNLDRKILTGTNGLLVLAKMLSAGLIIPPWQLHLKPTDFKDSFDDDMGYTDAFRLWAMSAFDDDEHMWRFLDGKEPPDEWKTWVEEHMMVMML